MQWPDAFLFLQAYNCQMLWSPSGNCFLHALIWDILFLCWGFALGTFSTILVVTFWVLFTYSCLVIYFWCIFIIWRRHHYWHLPLKKEKQGKKKGTQEQCMLLLNLQWVPWICSKQHLCFCSATANKANIALWECLLYLLMCGFMQKKVSCSLKIFSFQIK